MSKNLSFHSKEYLSPLNIERQMENSHMLSSQMIKRAPRSFPDANMLGSIWECENDPHALRASAWRRTWIGFSKHRPAVETGALAKRFESEYGNTPSDSPFVYYDVQDEISVLVKTLQSEMAGEKFPLSRSVCVHKPELGCKITVQVQTKNKVRMPLFIKKDVLAVCIIISPINFHPIENKQAHAHTIFCTGKATILRWGWCVVKTNTDLKHDGRVLKRRCIRWVGLKGLKKRTRGEKEEDTEMLILK